MNDTLILPFVPQNITVHLGSPSDSSAANVTVPFPDYIKNVASSEIYPSWPQSALRANILAQISFALNRIYTEYYRSRGYDFDITNDTSVDQSFVRGRDYFDTVSDITDELFNSYIRRVGRVEPLFAQYCNGTTTMCDGLSQWGSVELANEGNDSVDILRYYYGDDIEIVNNAPVRGITDSYPNEPLRAGSIGDDVRFVQLKLNRVSLNYPSIPKINPVSGIYSFETENAVREFQRIFGLTADGVVGKSTWYKLQYIYAAVKKLNDLASEGLTYADVSKQYPDYLAEGASGEGVRLIQYYLDVISQYEQSVLPIVITGNYDNQTSESVRSFQQTYDLEQTGIIDEETYNLLFDVYSGIIANQNDDEFASASRPFPGGIIPFGEQSENVRYFQSLLELISETFTQIPSITPDGVFGENTLRALQAFENLVGLPEQDYISIEDWQAATDIAQDIRAGLIVNNEQYPGYVIDKENAS